MIWLGMYNTLLGKCYYVLSKEKNLCMGLAWLTTLVEPKWKKPLASSWRSTRTIIWVDFRNPGIFF